MPVKNVTPLAMQIISDHNKRHLVSAKNYNGSQEATFSINTGAKVVTSNSCAAFLNQANF